MVEVFVTAEQLRVSAYPEIQQAMDDATTAGLFLYAWRDEGEEVVSLEAADGGAELVLSHRGKVHRLPVDPNMSTRALVRIWRATRVSR